MSRRMSEVLESLLQKQILLHESGSEVGNRCVLEEVGDDYIGVRYRTGERAYYNLANVISVQSVE